MASQIKGDCKQWNYFIDNHRYLVYAKEGIAQVDALDLSQTGCAGVHGTRKLFDEDALSTEEKQVIEHKIKQRLDVSTL